MRFLGNGILQVIIVVGKTRVGLELAHIICLQNRGHRRAMQLQAGISAQIGADRTCVLIKPHHLVELRFLHIGQRFQFFNRVDIVLYLVKRGHARQVADYAVKASGKTHRPRRDGSVRVHFFQPLFH